MGSSSDDAVVGAVDAGYERQFILAAVRDLLHGARPGWQVHRTGLPPFNPMVYSLETALPVLNLGGHEIWAIARQKAAQSGKRAVGPELRPKVAPDAADERSAAPAAIDGPRSWLEPGFSRAGFIQIARIVETLLCVVLALLAVAGFAGVLRKQR